LISHQDILAALHSRFQYVLAAHLIVRFNHIISIFEKMAPSLSIVEKSITRENSQERLRYQAEEERTKETLWR